MITRHSRWIIGLVLALAMVLLLSPVVKAATPLYLYLKIGGQDVEGSVDRVGKEDSCEILSFEQTTSLSGGKPQFTLTFQKPIDKASPDITKAILDQSLVDAKFRFYRVDATGAELHYYTVEVTGQIVSSTLLLPDVKDPANQGQNHTERVTMAIRSISWTFVPDNEKVTSGSGRLIKQ